MGAFLSNLFIGRLNRRNFLIGEILIAIPYIILQSYVKNNPADATILLVLIAIIIVPFGFSLLIRRLHDCHASGWWSVLALVPIGNLVLMIFTFVKEGDKGTNKYGEPPSQKIHFPNDILNIPSQDALSSVV